MTINLDLVAGIAAAACFALALLGYFGAGMASRALTSEDLRFPRTMLVAAGALVIFILAGCAGQAERPEPIIKTVEVKVPVDDPACAREAVAELGAAPVYPDDATALKMAADLFERVKLLLAARELRTVREAQLHGALIACASRSAPPP